MEWIDTALRVGGGVGLPGIITYFLVQRRRAKADATVAERTVNSTVVKADVGALEAHMLAVEAAFTMERASKDRQIAALRAEVQEVQTACDEKVAGLTAELRRKDGIIRDLTEQVSTLTERLGRLERQQGQGGQ